MTGEAVDPARLRELYAQIAPIVESPTGDEAQRAVLDYSELLFKDARSEAEMLMLLHGHATSDRYLVGLCSAVVSMRQEKGGHLPGLTEGQYEMDKEVQDSHQAAQDPLAQAYFARLEEAFGNNFPLTATLLGIMERDLRSRFGASDTEIEEGFQRGWYKAAKAVVPLFMDQAEPA